MIQTYLPNERVHDDNCPFRHVPVPVVPVVLGQGSQNFRHPGVDKYLHKKNIVRSVTNLVSAQEVGIINSQ